MYINTLEIIQVLEDGIAEKIALISPKTVGEVMDEFLNNEAIG